jgi:TRAP transporter TAXI family solute receptor
MGAHIKRFLFLFLLLVCCFSCKKDNEYTMATLDVGTTYYRNGMAISEILKQKDIKIEILTGKDFGSYTNCRMLWNDEIDFAIAQNDTKVIDFLEEGMSIADSKIRTVTPLYPEILYVLYADTIHPTSLRDLVTGRRIGVGPENSGTSKFFRFLLTHFTIPASDYTFVYTSWADNEVGELMDISVTLAGYNTPNVLDMVHNKNCEIYSFGKVDLFQRGSSVEGFCMSYPAARPFIIPMNTYGSKPSQPALTIAIDAVLLCNKEMDPYVIYSIVEEIFKQKNVLSNIDPLLCGLTENFQQTSLSFPLHEGTKMYLERNEPSFFERYAETIGVVFSILIAGIGAFATLVRWRKHNKKNRVDTYFQKVLNIESNLPRIDTEDKCRKAVEELKSIKHKAFNLMIDEKLEANESFNIFLTLVDNLIIRIEKKM